MTVARRRDNAQRRQEFTTPRHYGLLARRAAKLRHFAERAKQQVQRALDDRPETEDAR